MKISRGLLVMMLFFLFLAAVVPVREKPITLSYPASWPKPVYDFSASPLYRSKIELGRKLFYDPLLSADSTISCSSCHLNYTAFTHVDHALSHGIRDSIGTRNSPVLINLAWSKVFMWDGAVNHLDVQALAPISHPAEMGENITIVLKKLERSKDYPSLFRRAFGSLGITGERLLKALAQFQLTLVSMNSKYDQVMRKEKGAVFTEQEQRGYDLFKKHCAACHTEPLFTNGEFINNGLKPDPFLADPGRMKISLDTKDSLRFKVPTLRNIEFSYPYMHDGRFQSLNQVMNHYINGIYASPTLDPRLSNGVALTSNDKVDVIAFLLTLTDKTFLFNPDFAYPK